MKEIIVKKWCNKKYYLVELEGRKIPVWRSKKAVKNKIMMSEFHKRKRVARYKKRTYRRRFWMRIVDGGGPAGDKTTRHSTDINGKCKKP